MLKADADGGTVSGWYTLLCFKIYPVNHWCFVYYHSEPCYLLPCLPGVTGPLLHWLHSTGGFSSDQGWPRFEIFHKYWCRCKEKCTDNALTVRWRRQDDVIRCFYRKHDKILHWWRLTKCCTNHIKHLLSTKALNGKYLLKELAI